MICDDLVEVVVVRGDAVSPVPIKVQPQAVKTRFGDVARLRGDLRKRRRQLRIVEPVAGDAPWYVDVTIVHPPAFALPHGAVAQRLEPRRRGRRIREPRNVVDRTGFVSDERPPPVAEDSELRQG